MVDNNLIVEAFISQGTGLFEALQYVDNRDLNFAAECECMVVKKTKRYLPEFPQGLRLILFTISVFHLST